MLSGKEKTLPGNRAARQEGTQPPGPAGAQGNIFAEGMDAERAIPPGSPFPYFLQETPGGGAPKLQRQKAG